MVSLKPLLIKFSLHSSFWVLMVLFILFHLAHISCFYSLKTYADTLDINKIRSHYINDTETQNDPLIIAEVLHLIWFFRGILWRDGGMATSSLFMNLICWIISNKIGYNLLYSFNIWNFKAIKSVFRTIWNLLRDKIWISKWKTALFLSLYWNKNTFVCSLFQIKVKKRWIWLVVWKLAKKGIGILL